LYNAPASFRHLGHATRSRYDAKGIGDIGVLPLAKASSNNSCWAIGDVMWRAASNGFVSSISILQLCRQQFCLGDVASLRSGPPYVVLD
jgi:hypothetical protein